MNAAAAAKTPMLIANATPTFSLVAICILMMNCHGMMANTKSRMPE